MPAPATENRETTAAESRVLAWSAWPLSVVLDAAFAACVYPLSYWLRFPGEALETFLPDAWSTLPLVVICQIVALGALGTYARRGRATWPIRLIAGIASGTVTSIVLVWLIWGLEHISRVAFAADAILLSIAGLGWRGVRALVMRTRLAGTYAQDELIDRAEEVTTLGAIVFALYRYRELLKNLVLKDLKLKYRGSVFGFLWSLVNPLLMIVVYTVAFTYILQVRREGFVFLLMLGILSWTFFANSANMSTGSIVDSAGLLRSVFFPRAILPVATVLFNLAQYLLTAAVFLPVLLAWYRVPLSATMVLFPVFLAMQVVFTMGVALVLATTTAFFRDMRHLLEVALAVLFWTTPIVYELRIIPEELRFPILLSPMSPFVVAYQKVIFYREWPEPQLWLVAATYAVGTFIIGATLLLTFEDRLAEHV